MKKIGIFDSGIGGLSIVTKLKNINLDTEIIYIADLNAIIDNKASHRLLNSIIEKNPSIIFWVDSGLKIINLKRRYVNYNPIFCSEKSTGFDIKNIPSNKFVCSLDYNKKIMGNTILPKLHRYLPKKIILIWKISLKGSFISHMAMFLLSTVLVLR